MFKGQLCSACRWWSMYQRSAVDRPHARFLSAPLVDMRPPALHAGAAAAAGGSGAGAAALWQTPCSACSARLARGAVRISLQSGCLTHTKSHVSAWVCTSSKDDLDQLQRLAPSRVRSMVRAPVGFWLIAVLSLLDWPILSLTASDSLGIDWLPPGADPSCSGLAWQVFTWAGRPV